LDLAGELEIYNHVNKCEICRDAACQLLHDRGGVLLLYHAYRLKSSSVQNPIRAAKRSLGACRRSQEFPQVRSCA
jgi:hypothetical protein